MSLRENHEDQRPPATQSPYISLMALIYKYWKDILAFIIAILCVSIMACMDSCRSKELSTLLISTTGAAIGFLFGKNSS